MRLIDADELFFYMTDSIEQQKAEEARDEAPTVDAVPVIRCKDCKHRDPEDKKCDCGHSILWQLPREDDWFCADAERKEE